MLQIVFDTNAYRRLVYDKPIQQVRKEFLAITGSEESKNFQIFMAPVPWIELYCHLADPSDPAFDNSLKAVVASFIHSRINGRTDRPKLMPQYLALLAQTLFSYHDEIETRVLLGLDGMAAAINHSPSIATINSNKKYLEDIRNFSAEKEQLFINSFKLLQENFHSQNFRRKRDFKTSANNLDFFHAWISIIIFQTAEFANHEYDAFTDNQMLSMIQTIAHYFPAPCYLANSILLQLIANKTFKIENGSRRNWFWDYQMLFYVSSQNPLLLVTNDGDMREAGRAAGISERIITLEGYMEMLQLNIPFR